MPIGGRDGEYRPEKQVSAAIFKNNWLIAQKRVRQMETLKKAELVVFQRMIEFQRGTMQSEMAFLTSQIAKFLLKDAFLILVFLPPLPSITDTVQGLFQAAMGANEGLTLSLGIFLSCFLFMAGSKLSILQQRFKYLIRLLIPWVDIFSLPVIAISIHLLLLNLPDSPLLAVFNLLSVVSISAIQIFYNIFHFTKEPRSNNLFKKRQALLVSLCNIVTLAIIYYLAFAYSSSHSLSSSHAVAFSLIQLMTSLLTMKPRIFLQYYLSPFSQSVSSLFYFLQVYLSLLVVLIHTTQLAMLAENSLLLLGCTTLLSFAALQAYLLRRNSAMYLSSASDLKDEDQAILYLDRLCELIAKVENEEEDVILVSLKKKHSLTCKAVECYCHKEGGSLGEFVKEYIKHELLSMAELFHSSPSILISILYFRMVVFKYYPEVLAKLNAYAAHFPLSLTQRYYRYCLTQYVARFIRKKNYEKEAIDSEHMFKLEELRTEMEGLIRGEIEIRSKKWRYLSRGLCRVSELEFSCNSLLGSIARLTAIFQQHKGSFRKSREFNLLFLFYFTKVSFLNNGKEIRQNLKELYFGYKEDELYSLKEFKKFIYHKRSCVIETVVDTKTMGIVSAASRNVEDMFGLPPSKVIGISINNLMPQFMAVEHEVILDEWAKSGTWRTIGKLKEIYCIHKEQYCFSALLYLKLYVKDNNLHFITNIFKLNENDFLVANPNFKIEGLGRKFLKLLGEPAKKMPLDLLIQHDNSLLQQENYAEGKVYRKIMLSLRGMEDEVESYIQSINMKFDPSDRQRLNLAFHEKLRKNCQDKYFVEFSIKKYAMRSVRFIVLGLKEAKKIDKLQSIQYLERHPTVLHNSKLGLEMMEFQAEDSRESILQREEEEEMLIEHNANSSLTSMTEKENYPLSKTVEKFIAFVANPPSINDPRLTNFNLVILILLTLLAALGFLSYYAYKQVLLEIEGVFFADGAQSDIMQTTEIAYAYTYMLKSQLAAADGAEFASTLQSARLVNSYVYALREADFASLISNVTVLTKERLYAYIQKPTVWSMNGQEQHVLTHQFLENMYYLTGRVVNELECLRESNSTTVSETFFKELFANFPEMKHLSEFFLDDYEQTSQYQHSLLSYLTMASMVFFLLLSLVLAIALNRYFRFRFDQLVLSFAFFSFIPSHYFDKMRDYYAKLIETVVERERLKNIDANEEEVFGIDTYDLFHKAETGRGGLSSKIRFMNYETYYKWLFILAVFAAINTINYMATKQVRSYFPISQAVIGQVNSLMRAENKMLEGYFDLRAAYSLDPSHFINQSLVDGLMGTFNQSQERFSSYANQLTSIFKDYDTNYEQDFTNTLISSICALVAPLLTPFENQKCIDEMKLNILDGGILIAMNYFQKNILQALQDLKQQYILGNASSSPQGDYFRQPAFVELDKMLIYMFKVFQQTQAVTYGAYIETIDAIALTYLKMTIGMTVFLGVGLLLWVRSIPGQKKALSLLYGHLLLVPFMILRANTRIVSSLKEAIEYSD